MSKCDSLNCDAGSMWIVTHESNEWKTGFAVKTVLLCTSLSPWKHQSVWSILGPAKLGCNYRNQWQCASFPSSQCRWWMDSCDLWLGNLLKDSLMHWLKHLVYIGGCIHRCGRPYILKGASLIYWRGHPLKTGGVYLIHRCGRPYILMGASLIYWWGHPLYIGKDMPYIPVWTSLYTEGGIPYILKGASLIHWWGYTHLSLVRSPRPSLVLCVHCQLLWYFTKLTHWYPVVFIYIFSYVFCFNTWLFSVLYWLSLLHI